MLCNTRKHGRSVGEKFLQSIKKDEISFGQEGLFIKLGEIRELVQQEWNKRWKKRFRELEAFKDEFGTCTVPQKNNPQLYKWCDKMRYTYSKLSQDRIKRLEEIGFQWQGVAYDETFEKRCRELIEFKEKSGHCNVPQRYTSNPELGKWCNHMRTAYTKIQNEMITDSNISQDRIDRLEEIGFKWKGVTCIYDETFEKRCQELIEFKKEFGNCIVPYKYTSNPKLGKWCSKMRGAYKKIQNGMITDGTNISQDRIDRLEEIGFKW